jgi:hypothetical protein
MAAQPGMTAFADVRNMQYLLRNVPVDCSENMQLVCHSGDGESTGGYGCDLFFLSCINMLWSTRFTAVCAATVTFVGPPRSWWLLKCFKRVSGRQPAGAALVDCKADHRGCPTDHRGCPTT